MSNKDKKIPKNEHIAQRLSNEQEKKARRNLLKKWKLQLPLMKSLGEVKVELKRIDANWDGRIGGPDEYAFSTRRKPVKRAIEPKIDD